MTVERYEVWYTIDGWVCKMYNSNDDLYVLKPQDDGAFKAIHERYGDMLLRVGNRLVVARHLLDEDILGGVEKYERNIKDKSRGPQARRQSVSDTDRFDRRQSPL